MRRSRVLVAVAGAFALAASLAVPSAVEAAPKRVFLINLGDSYAAGYQYNREPASLPLKGYANQLAAKLKAKKHPMTLINFGCGGATTSSLMSDIGCPDPTGYGAKYTDQSQLNAALDFISAHPGQIGLVTIALGGNDFDSCPLAADPISCVANAMAGMKANLISITSQLRTAVGAKVPMIAITYPDVILGAWLKGTDGQGLATLSVQLFKNIINPTFVAAYAPSNVSFVDVTKATGAYTSLDKTTTLKPYGTIPVAVAKVCTLTWFCVNQSIHPRTSGYTLIAGLLEARYEQLRKAA